MLIINQYPSNSLNQFFNVQLSESTPYLCVKELDDKILLCAEAFPEDKKISALLKQARLFQILAEKLTVKMPPNSNLLINEPEFNIRLQVKEKTEAKLQILSEKILQKTSLLENSKQLNRVIDELLINSKLADDQFLKMQKIKTQDLLKKQIPLEDLFVLPEDSAVDAELGAQLVNPFESLFLPPDDNSVKIPALDLDLCNKIKSDDHVLGTQAKINEWRMLHQAVQNSPESKERVVDTTHAGNQLPKSALGPLTYMLINEVINSAGYYLPDWSSQSLANDIYRIMPFATLTYPNEVLIRKGYSPDYDIDASKLEASIQHFDYLLRNFLIAYCSSDNVFVTKVLNAWMTSMEGVNEVIAKQKVDFTTSLQMDPGIITESLQVFLKTIFNNNFYPENPLLTKRIGFFLMSIQQTFYVTPTSSLLLATSNFDQLIQKNNGRQYEFIFDENCYNLRVTQSFLIPSIKNCKLNIVNLLSCNLSPKGSWTVDLHVHIDQNYPEIKKLMISSDPHKITSSNDISADGIKIIKKKLIPQLTECGFRIKFSKQIADRLKSKDKSYFPLKK